MTKHQKPNNSQSPSSNNQIVFGDWVIGIYLELGIWLLKISYHFSSLKKVL